MHWSRCGICRAPRGCTAPRVAAGVQRTTSLLEGETNFLFRFEFLLQVYGMVLYISSSCNVFLASTPLILKSFAEALKFIISAWDLAFLISKILFFDATQKAYILTQCPVWLSVDFFERRGIHLLPVFHGGFSIKTEFACFFGRGSLEILAARCVESMGYRWLPEQSVVCLQSISVGWCSPCAQFVVLAKLWDIEPIGRLRLATLYRACSFCQSLYVDGYFDTIVQENSILWPVWKCLYCHEVLLHRPQVLFQYPTCHTVF